uniref:Uncharacterized protein n=1 Tax=Sipha flava TaxID=143950 RepID=A0A2S2QLE1_9HEMI
MESKKDVGDLIKPLNRWQNLNRRLLVNVPIEEYPFQKILEPGYLSSEKILHTESDQTTPEAVCFYNDRLPISPQEPDFFIQPFFNPVKYSTEGDTGIIYNY